MGLNMELAPILLLRIVNLTTQILCYAILLARTKYCMCHSKLQSICCFTQPSLIPNLVVIALTNDACLSSFFWVLMLSVDNLAGQDFLVSG